MSKKTADKDSAGLLDGKDANDSDEGDFAELKPKKASELQQLPEAEAGHLELKVPEKLNVCQWIVVAILYLVFAFLVGFIIYISSTWNKDRTNEYT